MGLELDDVLEHKELFKDDGMHDLEYDEEGHLLVGEGQTSQGDTDEWIDCTSEEICSTSQSQTSNEADLRVNVHLNPDAPEFMPSSPVMPLSPESNKTPSGKEKVANWRETEMKRKNRSPRTSESSRSERSEVDAICEEEEDREDREATPRGDNFEDAEENAAVKSDAKNNGGVKKIADKDSEVKTESAKSGSNEEAKNAPTGKDSRVEGDKELGEGQEADTEAEEKLHTDRGQEPHSQADIADSQVNVDHADSAGTESDSVTETQPSETGLLTNDPVPSGPPDEAGGKDAANKTEVEEKTAEAKQGAEDSKDQGKHEL